MTKNNLIDCSGHVKHCFNQPFNHINKFSNIMFEVTDMHYSPLTENEDRDFLRNDWGVISGRAFKIVSARLAKDKNCLIVGTGIGLDALNLIEAISPSKLVITDLYSEIVDTAKLNIIKNLQTHFERHQIVAVESNLFNNPIFSTEKFDLIFENLPNLPSAFEEKSDQPTWGSFYYNRSENIPYKYQLGLLSSHYECLSKGKYLLKANGSFVCNIGARIPLHLLYEMFDELGYSAEILIFDFKKQNETLVNLKAYAEWERISQIEFIFYRYNEAMELLSKYDYDPISGFNSSYENIEQIQEELQPVQVSAEMAYDIHNNNNNIRIGHLYYSIYAKPKK